MASTQEKMIRRDLKVEPYAGTNEVINRLRDESDTIWVVQGSHGRVPILAMDEDSAKDRYVEKFAHRMDDEEDEEVEE